MTGLSWLRDWRTARDLSVRALAERSGVAAARIEAIETAREDFSGAELHAIADAIGCDAWRLMKGAPEAEAVDFAFQQRLLAQMLRDLCVEAVTTYADMGRLDELKVAEDADAFWLSVAALFKESLDQIRRTPLASAFAVP